jgi:hypothetical protein
MLTRKQLEIARILAGDRAGYSGGDRSIIGGRRAILGEEDVEAYVDGRGFKPSRQQLDDAVTAELARRAAASVPMSRAKSVDLRTLPYGVRSPATVVNGTSVNFNQTVIWDTKPKFLIAGPQPTNVIFRVDQIIIQGRNQLPGGAGILLSSFQGTTPVALNLDTIPQNGDIQFFVTNLGTASGFFELTAFCDVFVET